MSVLSDNLLHIAKQCYVDQQYAVVYSSCWAGHIKTAVLNTKDGHSEGGGFPIEHVLAVYTVDDGWQETI